MASSNLTIGKQQEVRTSFPDHFFDSLVTDPPYGLKFMGHKWDYNVPTVEDWAQAFRTLKPGAYGVVFCGTRTQHRMVVNLEDAGFEIRDVITWVYATGFPKNMNLSKAFDKANGHEREVIGTRKHPTLKDPTKIDRQGKQQFHGENSIRDEGEITAPSSEEAKNWDGWGTALKPATELITLIRKPMQGTTIENLRTHGVGALNIDACRITPTGESLDGGDVKYRGKKKSAGEGWDRPWMSDVEKLEARAERGTASQAKGEKLGRYPANLIHDGSAEVIELFPHGTGAAAPVKEGAYSGKSRGKFVDFAYKGNGEDVFYNDSGSAARFFYAAKPAPSERNAGTTNGNNHVTVKPIALMRYLVKLITPVGGTCLDPYAGSGTTGCAALMEGVNSVLIDQDPTNEVTIRERLEYWSKEAAKGVQSKIF